MGEIIFSPISKRLKLDFSMSHSDERSRSEEISPTKDTPRGRPVHDWSDIYSLKVLKNEKYRFVKEQLVVDFELLN